MANKEYDEIFTTDKKQTIQEISQENSKLEQALAEEGKKKLDPSVLAKLKAKVEDKMPEVTAPRSVSIEMGIIGLGAAGGRLAEEFYHRGYKVRALNTSSQDLDVLTIPKVQKFLIDGSLGGTGKSRDLSLSLFSEKEEEILEFLQDMVGEVDMLYLCSAGGGGTGSGSLSFMTKLIQRFNLPIGIIYILPKNSEGAISKSNTLETLSELVNLTTQKIITSLIIIDNYKLEIILKDIGHGLFWKKANNLIIDPLDRINHLTVKPTFESLDPSDFGKILTAGGITVYGIMEVEDYLEETALAEAAIGSLSNSILSEDFDLAQATVGGIIFVGPAQAINNTPSINFDYCQHVILEKINGADLFRGIYIDNTMEDKIEIITIFSGLGLPAERINYLQKEVENLSIIAQEKETKSPANLTLNLNKEKTKTNLTDIHKKIQGKNNAFNKIQSKTSIIDQRRKK